MLLAQNKTSATAATGSTKRPLADVTNTSNAGRGGPAKKTKVDTSSAVDEKKRPLKQLKKDATKKMLALKEKSRRRLKKVKKEKRLSVGIEISEDEDEEVDEKSIAQKWEREWKRPSSERRRLWR
jgi:hypothetical protein